MLFRAVPAAVILSLPYPYWVCLKPAIHTHKGEMMVDTHRGEMIVELCATTAAIARLALLCSQWCDFSLSVGCICPEGVVGW